MKENKPINVERLINWYHGNFCAKHKNSTKEHYKELKKITISWNILEMTYRDFCNRIRQKLRCDSNKVTFDDCLACGALGIHRKY